MRLKSTRGFTLIELLVVVAIIALLIAILLPSLARAKTTAQRVRCAAVLKGWGTAIYTYSQEFEGNFGSKIGTPTWASGLYDRQFSVAINGGKLRTCPADASLATNSTAYLFARYLPREPSKTQWKISQFKGLSNRLVMADGYVGGNTGSSIACINMPTPAGGSQSLFDTLINAAPGGGKPPFQTNVDLENRHKGTGSVLFLDGHVITAKWSEYVENIPDQGWAVGGSAAPGDVGKKWTQITD